MSMLVRILVTGAILLFGALIAIPMVQITKMLIKIWMDLERSKTQ